MSERYAGKHVVVTGGASGIGEASARRLAQEGASVVILDRNLAGAERVASQIGGRAAQVDVANPVSVAAAFDSLDRVDVLVNSAGIAHVGDILKTTLDDFDRVHDVNVKGVFLCMMDLELKDRRV